MGIDLKETKDRIIDELTDAIKYMQKAVEHKGTEWGTWFCQMSKNEIEHANILLKMFTKTKSQEDVSDATHKELYSTIMESYITAMTKIENLKKLYWSE